MINLFDTYDQYAWDLHYSLICSGYDHPTIVIQDDGFLPEDVTSPYLFFTGFSEEKTGRPRYFNELRVPDFWEIRANNTEGECFDLHRKRAHIRFARPTHQRFIQSVDWYDDLGRVRIRDRYNKFGYRFAQTVLNRDGQEVLTSYFTKEGQDVLVENHVTGDLTLNDQGQVYLFKNKVDFITFYLHRAGFSLDRIFYNSLSTPFLVAYYLGAKGQDVLFWQEDIGTALPGNMTLALKQTLRPTQVMVQLPGVFEKMQPLLSPEEASAVHKLGFLYPFTASEHCSNEALILTNSDQIEGLDTLVQTCPTLHFHIGAITEMSSRLLAFGAYPNVTLYPNISMPRVKSLFSQCGLYLDINHGNEILSSLRTAFEHRQLILALAATVHQSNYVADAHIFSDVEALQACIQAVLADDAYHASLVNAQEMAAGLETSQHYRLLIG